MSATARRRERRGQLEAAQLRIRELEALLRSTRPWLLQRLAAGEQNCARLRAELRCAHVMAAERTGETERLRAATRALEAEQYASSPQGKLENALSFTAEQSSDLWRRGSQGFSAAFAGLLAEAAAGADATTEDGGAAGASGTDDDDDDDDDDGTAGTSHASTHSGAERSAGGGVEIPPPSPPRLPRAPLGVDDALAPAPPPPPRPPPLPVLLDDDAALVQANAHADAEAARLADEVADHRVLLAQLGRELLAARRRAMEVGVAQWAVQHAHEAAHDAAEDVADAEVEAAAAAAAAATVAAAAAAAAVGAGSVGTREAELAALRAQVAAAAAEADADAKRRASSLLPSERD